MGDPQDPLSALAAAAVGAHELFTAFTGAGFTESQALFLVAEILTASIGND